MRNNLVINKSLPFLLGTLVANIFNYLFHLTMGRLLGPKEFGVFLSLLSLTVILSIFPATVQLIVTKLTAQYAVKNDYASLYSLFIYLKKKLFFLGLIIFLVFLILLPPLARFINVPPLPLFLSFLIIPTVFFPLSIARGSLAGLQAFKKLGINISLEGAGKFVLGLLLVLAGLKSSGAIGGILISLIFVYLVSLRQLKPFFHHQEKKAINVTGWLNFSLWAFLLNFFILWIFNADIILVKHFFSEDLAGQYAALVTLGKIILIFSLAANFVLFPIVIEKKEKGENLAKILRQSLGLVGLLSGLVLVPLFLFPDSIITIVFGPAYLPVSGYLGLYGVSIFFFSLSSVFLYYFLALKKERLVSSLIFLAFLQIFLIFRWHQSLGQIIVILFSLMASLLLFLVLYYFVARKRSLALIP
ncbi:MAG: oligosaccharide flippase family protein [Patescibacteria group bacterium]